MKTLLAALALASLLSGCMANDDGAGSTSPTTTAATGQGEEVELRDNRFDPASLDVAAGTSVRFVNEDARRHAVTIHWVGDPADTWKLDEELAAGEDVAYTFATPGTYHVWCGLHGSMMDGMAMVVTAT